MCNRAFLETLFSNALSDIRENVFRLEDCADVIK